MFTIIELFKGFKGLSRIEIDELTVQLFMLDENMKGTGVTV